MLVGAIIGCVVKVLLNRQQGIHWSPWLLAGAFLGGLTFGIHQMLIFLMPGFIVWILYELKSECFAIKRICPVVLFFLAGYSVLLYLPIRAAQEPAYAWENPESWNNFKQLVTTATFHGQRFVRSFDQFRDHITNYIRAYFHQWPIVLLVFPFFGWSYVKLKNKGFFFFLLTCLVINVVSSTMLFNLSARWFFTLDIFYLPGFFVLSIWGGVMIGYFLELMKKRNRFLVMVGFALLSVFLILGNVQECSFRDRTLMRDWGVQCISTLPSGAILITQQDEIFGLWYLKYGEGWGENIALLHYESLRAPESWFWRTVKNQKIRTCIQQYTGLNYAPADNQIIENLNNSCGFPVYATRHSSDNDYGLSWEPWYMAWKLGYTGQQQPFDYRYEIFPVNAIEFERMDQVERYYLNAYIETYKTLAQLEEDHGNNQKAIALWKMLFQIDKNNRRSALRNITRLSMNQRN
jgi:hypothetical protein